MPSVPDKESFPVLIIEDEPLLRSFLADYLRYAGYIVVEADGGRDGIEKIRKENPAVVITDLRMTDVNGLEVLDTLTRERPGAAAIVISGTASPTEAIEEVREKIWEFIQKPVNDMVVVEMAIERCIGKLKSIRENAAARSTLERAEESFDFLFQNSSDAVIIHDANLAITAVNASARQLLNRTGTAAAALTMADILAAGSSAAYQGNMETVKKSRQSVFQSFFVDAHGVVFPVTICLKRTVPENKESYCAICRKTGA